MFGTSTANVKIESLWMRMLRSQTRPWLEFFHYLQNNGLYESDVLEDRVVFLFVFVPILRDEIATFVETWNEHRIRSQRNRPNHVAGIPNELYTSDVAPRFGWTPDASLLLQLSETVKDFDPDAYLSDDSLTWCKGALQALGHSGTPLAKEFFPAIRHFLVPRWYRQLRIKAREHIESGDAPELLVAPKPDTAHEWQVRQQVMAEMRNEVDTFGLIEAGDVGDNQDAYDEDWDY